MTRLVAIDPGDATGMAEGTYSDTEPLTFDRVWTIPNGIEGFAEAYWNEYVKYPGEIFGEELVVETFVLRANEFLANVRGVEIIGFIKGVAPVDFPIWQERTDKAALTGAGQGDSEVRNNNFLKRNNLWQTGKMVGWKDGRDANDAIIHALVHMKNIRHQPTLRKYWS